jgi:hypothetical protein
MAFGNIINNTEKNRAQKYLLFWEKHFHALLQSYERVHTDALWEALQSLCLDGIYSDLLGLYLPNPIKGIS